MVAGGAAWEAAAVAPATQQQALAREPTLVAGPVLPFAGNDTHQWRDQRWPEQQSLCSYQMASATGLCKTQQPASCPLCLLQAKQLAPCP